MTAPPVVDAPPPEAADLACPLCGYSLRGLTTPRCPECGFAFTWAELLDARRDRHPWLFEHGRGRNVRTFVATYRRTWRPWRFWRAVTPAHAVHVGRVVAYWLVACLPAVAIAGSAWVPGVVGLGRYNLAGRSRLLPMLTPGGQVFVTPGGTVTRAMIDRRYPTPWSWGFVVQVWHGLGSRFTGRSPAAARVAAAATVVAWPWVSALALLLFGQSMRRAQVKRAHVVRAAVYGCDFGPLMAAAVVGYFAVLNAWPAAAAWVDFWFRSPIFPRDVGLVVFVVLACAAAATYRLTAAYAAYLRFHWPLPTVLAAQAVAVVVAAAVLFATVLRV